MNAKEMFQGLPQLPLRPRQKHSGRVLEGVISS